MSLMNRLRNWDNWRRKSVLHDYKHLNCGECWAYRTNHLSRNIKRFFIIGIVLTPILSFILLTPLFSIDIPRFLWTLSFLTLMGYWVLGGSYVINLFWIPPHKKAFLKSLRKNKKTKST